MSGWDNLEGKNTRTGARVVENAKLRHPGHLGLDHVPRLSLVSSGTCPPRCPPRKIAVGLFSRVARGNDQCAETATGRGERRASSHPIQKQNTGARCRVP
eukprot:3288511-Prymnesium_polylepis.1